VYAGPLSVAEIRRNTTRLVQWRFHAGAVSTGPQIVAIPKFSRPQIVARHLYLRGPTSKRRAGEEGGEGKGEERGRESEGREREGRGGARPLNSLAWNRPWTTQLLPVQVVSSGAPGLLHKNTLCSFTALLLAGVGPSIHTHAQCK